jgi:malate permease and related proteins
MFEWQVVFLKIAGMFLVMFAGWLACRRGYLAADVTRTLGRMVVDITFPALVFTQMLRTVSPSALRGGWWIPLLAAASIGVSLLVGLAMTGVAGARHNRRTFVFLVGMSNWIYIPLAIATVLYPVDGVRFVLLYNVGGQLTLWTLNVWVLSGGGLRREQWKGLVANPGVVATLLGIVVAVLWPAARTLGQVPAAGCSWCVLAADPVVTALSMIGDLTIPLSLLVTGAQLGSLVYQDRPAVRQIASLLTGRLVAAPLVILAVLCVADRVAGLRMAGVDYTTTIIITSMPVAVSCSMFIERFGGDRGLGALGIFWSTLLSVVTVPAMVMIAQLCR